MTGCLVHAGYRIAKTAEDADVLVYNTCAVKTRTENRMIEILKKARASAYGKRLVVAGCLPLVNYDRVRNEVDFDGIVHPAAGEAIVETVDRVLRREHVVLEKNLSGKPSLDLPRVPTNPVISIVPIAQGCLGSCTYCCVVLARGRLQSCVPSEITHRVRLDLDAGAKEVWLTAQDTGCYGKDIGLNLAGLIKEVCEIESEFFIRVGMMTPNFALNMLPDLVDAFKNHRVFRFLHLPVQSGDEEVLKSMNRFYTVNDFKRVVATFRKTIPDLTLATDVIVGFPGESAEAFERTMQLITDVKPDVINISRFFARPNTAAERMTPKIAQSEIVERGKKMTELARRMTAEKNRAWIGWKGRILVDEVGKQPESFIGRNFAYKPIVVKNSDHLMLGKSISVQVKRSFRTYLEAEIVN